MNIIDKLQLLRNLYVGLYEVHGASVKKLGLAVGDLGVSPAQLGVLVNIPERGATMTELIRKVGCAPSNMTSMIRRMERDGYVQTGRNPEDQRETLVHLTETGNRLLEQVRPAYADFLEDSYGCLSTAEQMMLCELLDKLRSKMLY